MRPAEADGLPTSKGYFEEREKLPEELRADFDSLVRWYRFYGGVHYGQPFVSYKILAGLVRSGWRLSAPPIEDAP